jgi:hypothetical protein
MTCSRIARLSAAKAETAPLLAKRDSFAHLPGRGVSSRLHRRNPSALLGSAALLAQIHKLRRESP